MGEKGLSEFPDKGQNLSRILVHEAFFYLVRLRRLHREVDHKLQPSYDIFRPVPRVVQTGQVPCTGASQAYTAKSLILHQHRANNQDRMANQI